MDWDGDGRANGDDEWVELYNPNAFPVDLSGWRLDDGERGSRAYTFHQARVPSHGFLVVYKRESGIALNNGGDDVRLFAGDGTLVDEVRYPKTERTDATSWSRTHDGFGAWTNTYPPSPGRPNRPPPPTPTPTPRPAPHRPRSASTAPTPVPFVAVNEFLPAPAGTVDWDGDGRANGDDEWIELYNPNAFSVDLSGWRLDDGPRGSRPYILPTGTHIEAKGFLLLYRRQTGLVLNNGGDMVRLISPTGKVIDAVRYPATYRTDCVSWARERDGGGAWRDGYPPSPGRANRPAAGSVFPSFRTLHRLPLCTPVQVQGQVVLPPGWFGRHSMYVAGDKGGIRVYMPWYTSGKSPFVRVNDRVWFVGVLRTYKGQREVIVYRPENVRVLSSRTRLRLRPPHIRPAELGYYHGAMVSLTGQVERYYKRTFYIRSGRFRVPVYAPVQSKVNVRALGVGRWVQVTGIVLPWRKSWELVVRSPGDLRYVYHRLFWRRHRWLRQRRFYLY